MSYWKEDDKKRQQGLTLFQETESILATRRSNNKPSSLEIKTLESALVVNKKSNQCVPPHVTPASTTVTSTHTHVYHQGHITSQDVCDSKWLESLALYVLATRVTTFADSHLDLVFQNNLWRVPLRTPPKRTRWTHHAGEGTPMIKSGTTNFLPAPNSTQNLKSVSTIKHIIATIQNDGFLHPLVVEQGYIDNGLRETTVNEYIKQTYGSLLRFLQDTVYTQEFKLTEDKHDKFYIDRTQRLKPTRIHPVDITPLDKDTASIMHLNLQKWWFPTKNIHAKIFEKSKGKGGFPKDFIWKLECHKDSPVTVSIGACAYRTSKRVQQRVSLGYSKVKYYLILVVDGIDFVWGQTFTTRTTSEDLIQEFLTMTNLKVSSVSFDETQEFGKALSFKSFCHHEKIVMEPVVHHTHIQNVSAENAIRVVTSGKNWLDLQEQFHVNMKLETTSFFFIYMKSNFM